MINIPSQWTFENEHVAESFDTHVREQLPWYDLVTEAIVHIGRHFIGHNGLIYDIGASNGNIGRALLPIINERSAELVAIEPSAAMASKYTGGGQFMQTSAETFDYQPFDFAVSMLTLMFLRPDDVVPLLDRLVRRVRPGGAIAIVERTLPPNGYMSIITSRLTLAAKASTGVSADQIIAKELSLAGVQRPIDQRIFKRYPCTEWFRFGDFAGFLIEGGADESA